MSYKSNIELGKVYTSSATEVITAQLVASDRGRGTIQIIEIDQNGNESVLASASVHFFPGSDVWVPCNTASALIHSGQNYKVVMNESSSPLNGYAYFNHI